MIEVIDIIMRFCPYCGEYNNNVFGTVFAFCVQCGNVSRLSGKKLAKVDEQKLPQVIIGEIGEIRRLWRGGMQQPMEIKLIQYPSY